MRLLAAGIAVALLQAVATSATASEECKPEQFAKVVDATGAYLREFSAKNQPILNRKITELGRKRGWAPERTLERGYSFVQDQTVTELDQRARKLVIELDEIDSGSETDHSCQRLQRLKTVTLELRAVTETKFSRMVKRVDGELKRSEQSASAPPPTKAKPVTQAQAPRPAPAPPPQWKTEVQSPPWPAPALSLVPDPKTQTYSAREIREAGRGFFGTISANLASVIRFAFTNYGKPNGYILGTEGSAALLAGVSFGKGRLVTKAGPPLQVYWQSPTVGYDLGAQGSRVMLLVYNLRQPEHIFRRYAGIGGSAYVVGGAGITILQRGRVVLAPIRTGVGLRLGANIGYMKFTPKLSINPF